MNDIKDYWEKRGRQYGSDIRGVLFKKPYPNFVNTMFHKWTYLQVKSLIPNKKVLRILDIGCGWGRVSTNLIKDFKSMKVSGIDLSSTYVSIFNNRLGPRGKAVVADMRKIPFEQQVFDVVFLIASFMYLQKKKDQQRVIDEVSRVLKQKGIFLLIEPTPLMRLLDLSNLFGLMKNNKEGFTSVFINDLIKSNKGKVIKESGWPSKLFPLYRSYIIKFTK